MKVKNMKVLQRIVIASDSHRHDEILEKIVNYENKININNVEIIFLCAGDSQSDASLINPFISVKGNCDFNHEMPNHLVIPVHKHRIFLTHGHLYSPLSLMYYLQENKCDICISGHTHVPSRHINDGIYYINPGSVSRPRMASSAQYLEMDIYEDGSLKFYDKFIEEID